MFSVRLLLPVCSLPFHRSGTSSHCYSARSWGWGSGIHGRSVSCSLLSWQSGEQLLSQVSPKVGSELHLNGNFSLSVSFPRPHDFRGFFMTWLWRRICPFVFWRLSIADNPWDHFRTAAHGDAFCQAVPQRGTFYGHTAHLLRRRQQQQSTCSTTLWPVSALLSDALVVAGAPLE